MGLWALTKGSRNVPDGAIVEIDLSYSKGQARWGLDEFIQADCNMPVWVNTGTKGEIVLKKHLVNFWNV